MYTTFEVSVAAMGSSAKAEYIDALKLLDILPFFHYENVSEEIFTRAWLSSLQVLKEEESRDDMKLSKRHVKYLRETLHKAPQTEELDIIALRNARDALASFSLITGLGSISIDSQLRKY